MRNDLRALSPLFLILIALPLTGTPPARAQAPKTVLQDRVLAVVDDDPILKSDVDRVIKLGLQQPNSGDAVEAFRRRVLNGLIEERLRFHEIDRFGFEQVPVDEIERNVAKIRARFPDEASFQKALKEVGLDAKKLRQLVARQLLVLTYVDERLGARVFVSLDDINRYYRDVLAPEMQRRGQPVPPVEDVREDIREVLKQQRLTQEIEKWTQELRERADVVVYGDQPSGAPLPPVVKKIEKPVKPSTAPRTAPGPPAPVRRSRGSRGGRSW
jgi:peptidyl-prolyl cis-trans isomerase SurA